MAVGDNIKSNRLRHHLTLDEVALKLNTSKQTIHRYETGVISNIPSDKVEALAELFQISPAALMGWEESHRTGRLLELLQKLGITPNNLDENDESALAFIEECIKKDNLDDRIRSQEHLEKYLSLNEQGQKKASEYLSDLVIMDKYNKNQPIKEPVIDEEDILLKETVGNILNRLGVPYHVRGYKYLLEAILLAIEDSKFTSLSFSIYPKIAKKFETTGRQVENGIRHAKEVICKSPNDDYTQIFGASEIPNSFIFITKIAESISLEIQAEGNAG